MLRLPASVPWVLLGSVLMPYSEKKQIFLIGQCVPPAFSNLVKHVIYISDYNWLFYYQCYFWKEFICFTQHKVLNYFPWVHKNGISLDIYDRFYSEHRGRSCLTSILLIPACGFLYLFLLLSHLWIKKKKHFHWCQQTGILSYIHVYT